MALDIYVGTLTRYYSRQWQTTAQQIYARRGIELGVLRPPFSPDRLERALAGEDTIDPDVVRPCVLHWRDLVAEHLKEHLKTPFDWDESPHAPYFVDMPGGRRCFNALVSWAQADAGKDAQRYFAIRTPTDMWLPCEFPMFQGKTPADSPATIGSSLSLLVDLDELNSRTWQADDSTLGSWLEHGPHGPPAGVSEEEEAKFAFSVVFRLAAAAVRHRLPMLMDE